jgi:ParB family chromosome partitioning protein
VEEEVTDAMREERAIDSIRIGRRWRKDMGDLNELAESIADGGLLNPVTITLDGRLVAGQRRLEAMRKLGWKRVPVRIVTGLDDAVALLRAEHDENTCRKDFTPSEAVELGRELERLERERARRRQAQAGPQEGRGRKPTRVGNLPEAVERARVNDKVGSAVGMSRRTYEKAASVVKAAEEDPARFGDLVEQMDRTGRVDPAYQKYRHRLFPMPEDAHFALNKDLASIGLPPKPKSAPGARPPRSGPAVDAMIDALVDRKRWFYVLAEQLENAADARAAREIAESIGALGCRLASRKSRRRP